MLLCTIIFFIIYIYNQRNSSLTASKVLVKVSLVYFMINKLNPDQTLIQIRRLEKVQHIDNTQRSLTDGPSHKPTGRYTLVFHFVIETIQRVT